MTETVELRPCPFCGSSTAVYCGEVDADTPIKLPPHVQCQTCGCILQQGMTKAEAIAAWNRRAIPPEIIAFLVAMAGHTILISDRHDDLWLAALAAAGMTEDEARREGERK